jgi:hypothetical protein
MCTVSWFHETGGYQLFCNRDEKKTRAEASGPRVYTRDGVRFVAPRDNQAGGTWIALNECGVTLCVLNGVPAGPVQPLWSRGRLAWELIASRSLGDLLQGLQRCDFQRYAPFVLVGLEPGNDATVAEWNGKKLRITARGESAMPLTSSSVNAAGAQTARRELLARMIEEGGKRAGTFLAFHRSHHPAVGPCSPCMHRADAGTVSFTWIMVNPAEATLYYSTGAPCASLAGESATLELAGKETVLCQACC